MLYVQSICGLLSRQRQLSTLKSLFSSRSILQHTGLLKCRACRWLTGLLLTPNDKCLQMLCRHGCLQLHWLWVQFNVAVLVFQCLSGNAPTHLADDCQLIADNSIGRHHSTDTATCAVRRSHNNFGDRCFTTAGPRPWNSLRSKLRQRDSLGEFKRLLKTHLFGDQGTVWHTWINLSVETKHNFWRLILKRTKILPKN